MRLLRAVTECPSPLLTLGRPALCPCLAEPATQYQECALFGPDGAACGALKYALAALKPMRVHPGATQRPAAASQPSHQAAQHAPAASSRAQPVQAASRLAVSVVGCRDLRPPGGSARGAPGLQPYVTLLLPVPAPGQPPLLFETRTAAGSSPSFQERASFGLGGGAAAQVLEAVVFDAAAGGAAGGNGIIGVARILLPPAGQGADGGATLHPLLHPTSGRHAGVLELGVRWE